MTGVSTEDRYQLGRLLTRQQVAEWLQVKPRQLDTMGVPCIDLGHKTKRYLVSDVLAWLDTQRRVLRNVA